MYSKIQLLCCSLLLAVSAFTQIFTYTPQKPKAGDKVLFTYDLSKTKLKDQNKDALDIGVMWMNVPQDKYPIFTPDFSIKGSVISGSFTVPASAHLLALRIVGSDNTQENNGGEGFFIPVHDAAGNPVSGAQLARARIVTAGAGEAMLGIQADDEKKIALIESVWKTEAIGRVSLLSSYLALTTKMKKNEAEPAVMKILAEAEATKELTIQEYTAIAFHYNRLKKADKAAAINQFMKDRFPEEMKKRNEYTTLAAISDFDKRFEAIQAFVQKYPAGNEADKSMYNRLYEGLINQYANNKQNVSISKIEQYAAGMDGVEKYRIYNDLAWQWVHNKDTMYAQAEVLSAKATAWARKEANDPTYNGQNYTTKKMLKGQGRYWLGMYADTYAEVQRKLKNFTGAYYASEEACKMDGWVEATYIDRFLLDAEKVLSREAFLQKAQSLAESGSLGKEGIAALERAKMQELGDAEKVKAYMASLNNKSLDKAKAEYAKNLIDEAAPDFTLKNMEGKTVSLKELKGKTVVIDFWATWCGPCKVSFPGMQQTLNKYKDRNDVVFLFVDTWERQPTMEQRKKEVTAFIEQNKYTFNVLYDEQNAQQEYDVVSRFKVEGIPTKFVINKEGRIRFKSVGGNANADKIVSEMTAMIELAEGGK